MKAPIYLFTLLFFLISPAWAIEAILEVHVQLHHSRQWTKVYEGKNGWHCETEHNPMFPLAGKPRFLSQFKGMKENNSSCKERFSAVLRAKDKTQRWTACLPDEGVSQFRKALGRECGRF